MNAFATALFSTLFFFANEPSAHATDTSVINTDASNRARPIPLPPAHAARPPTPSHSAETSVTFEAPCPLSPESRADPAGARPHPSVTFQILSTGNPPNLTLVTTGLETFTQTLSRAPIAHRTCGMRSFKSFTDSAITQSCERLLQNQRPRLSMSRAARALSCESQLRATLDELTFSTATSFSGELEGEAASPTTEAYLPFESLDPLQLRAYRSNLRQMREQVERSCSLGPGRVTAANAQEAFFLNQMILSQKFITEELPRILSQVGPGCQSLILGSLTQNFGNPPRVGTPREQNAAHQTLNFLRTQIEGVNETRDLGICLPQEHSTLVDQFTQSRLAISDITACTPLREGESTVPHLSGTPVAPEYRLTRNGEQEYTAEVNLAFEPEERAGEMRQQTERCYAGLNTMLARTGPGVGQLRIALAPRHPQTESPTTRRLPRLSPTTVTMRPAPFRSNSHEWQQPINCATIAHETLHLLGLVDEYRETVIGYHQEPGQSVPTRLDPARPGDHPEYACRTIGAAESIMLDQEKAYDRFLNNRDATLLYPAQFRAITQPGCYSANPQFYDCAQYAYTPTPFGAASCPADIPSACRATGGSALDAVPRWLQEPRRTP